MPGMLMWNSILHDGHEHKNHTLRTVSRNTEVTQDTGDIMKLPHKSYTASPTFLLKEKNKLLFGKANS